MGHEHLLGPLGREGDLPGERLVEKTAERVDVGARVERPPSDLFRGQVAQRAGRPAACRRSGVERLHAQAEVGQVRVLGPGRGVHENVGGLYVAVDQAARMRGIKSLGDLADDPDGQAGRQGPASRDELTAA